MVLSSGLGPRCKGIIVVIDRDLCSAAVVVVVVVVAGVLAASFNGSKEKLCLVVSTYLPWCSHTLGVFVCDDERFSSAVTQAGSEQGRRLLYK